MTLAEAGATRPRVLASHVEVQNPDSWPGNRPLDRNAERSSARVFESDQEKNSLVPSSKSCWILAEQGVWAALRRLCFETGTDRRKPA